MSEAVYRRLTEIDDRITEAQEAILSTILERQGVQAILTSSPEERIRVLTEALKELNEREGIVEIRAALGGDDDLDVLAKALVDSGVVKDLGVELSLIRILKVPTGPAPEEIRQAWLGTEMIGVRLPTESGNERDFLTGEVSPARDAYAVLTLDALLHLQAKSPAAAEWFCQNLREGFPALTFGTDEIEVISSIST